MIIPKTSEEIELMRQSALMVSKTLGMIASEIKEGVTTLELDRKAEEFIREKILMPKFKGQVQTTEEQKNNMADAEKLVKLAVKKYDQ